jgi:serine/threonine-protein kinase
MPDDRVIAGKYRLIAKLSKGGMGSVWRAQHMELDCPAAVKLLEPAFAESPEALARFKREAQSAASLRSTNVVQIFDFGVDNGSPYIAMELLRGESLAERLARKSPLSPTETALILGQVARAAGYAHSMGIIHRDLKPGNIFISEDAGESVVKLVDFGIAKPAHVEAGGAPVTMTGAIMGTPQYMSPEQASGRGTVDRRTDVWSFGIVAFECLTGQHAFWAETLASLLLAICTDPLPVPSQVGRIPRGFDEWFARCVHRDPSQRFDSITEAADELRAICGIARPSPLMSSADGQPETLCSSSSDARAPKADHRSLNSTTHAASIVSLVANPPARRWVPYVLLAGLFGTGAVVAAVWRFSGATEQGQSQHAQALQASGATQKSPSQEPAPVEQHQPPQAPSVDASAAATVVVLVPPTLSAGASPSAKLPEVRRLGPATQSKARPVLAVAPSGSASSDEPAPAPTLAPPAKPVPEETVESEFGFNRATKKRGTH